MPQIIDTSGWQTEPPKSCLVRMWDVRLPVVVKHYAAPNNGYSLLYPQGYLAPALWAKWISYCKTKATFDPTNKRWVFSRLVADRITTENVVDKEVTGTREALREKRRIAEAEFDKKLAEIQKDENVPEALWPTFSYPPQLNPSDPQPTALQRILVSRYWNQPAALLGASVGTGKSRVVCDILTARALSPASKSHNDSARIVLLIAPLSLHENWKREFAKWSDPRVDFRVIRFSPTPEFWRAAEHAATHLFDGPSLRAGGLVIVCTPHSLSRASLVTQLAEHQYVPTGIIIDEAHRFFRNPNNTAYKNVSELRKKAHVILALSGTPTAKMEDYYALEELLRPGEHWKSGTYLDYQRLGTPETLTSSGLHENGWSFERSIKEYHAYRINTKRIFVASKSWYMKDSLPNLDQEELGEFADTRLSLSELFDNEALVKEAVTLQRQCSPGFKPTSSLAFVQTTLLRLQQLAARSEANQKLLEEFVADFLEKDEPCVFWTLFRNEPCIELPNTVRYLTGISPTGWIEGSQDERQRWSMIDHFQNGKLRFLVCQTEAGGVGINLIRASKCLFLSIPFGYLACSQALGRLHRIGQEKDVTSYFAMTSPVTSFARSIYDRRSNLNETIPANISELIKKYGSDT